MGHLYSVFLFFRESFIFQIVYTNHQYYEYNWRCVPLECVSFSQCVSLGSVSCFSVSHCEVCPASVCHTVRCVLLQCVTLEGVSCFSVSHWKCVPLDVCLTGRCVLLQCVPGRCVQPGSVPLEVCLDGESYWVTSFTPRKWRVLGSSLAKSDDLPNKVRSS